MKAVIFDAVGQPLRVGLQNDPAPEPGEVLLRVAACGICGASRQALSLATNSRARLWPWAQASRPLHLGIAWPWPPCAAVAPARRACVANRLGVQKCG